MVEQASNSAVRWFESNPLCPSYYMETEMYLTRQEIVEIYGEKTAKTLTTVHCTPAPGRHVNKFLPN